MTTHFVNIERIINPIPTPLSPLRGEALGVLEHKSNAFISVDNGVISQVGDMSEFNRRDEAVYDLSGKWVLPCWVDSHTHTIFAAYRSEEFRMRLEGRTYQEIAEAGGGILNSASRLREMSEKELVRDTAIRIDKMIRKGTGALEIKSGYGLSTESEIKMLRVIRELKHIMPIPIKATFLGAHALPKEYKNNSSGYLSLIIDEMLPAIAEEGLADYCDIFCETGYFTSEETQRLSSAARSHGIPMKIHTNQFTSIGGIQTAVENGAKSVDHLEILEDADIEALSGSTTIATLLPIAPFFLKDPYPRGRDLVENDVAIALATDFNPGSAPSHDMALSISLACNYCGLTPEEAFNAATINAAHAIDLEGSLGALGPGMLANFQICGNMSSIAEIPYRICSELIDDVIINGEFYNGKIL